MALVTLPSSPGPRAVRWTPRDFGGTVSGALGGSAQRVNRLGNRWMCEVEMPVLTPVQAREWSAALMRALRNGASWRIRQVGTPTGSPGSPLVNGAGQAGDSLTVDGFNPGYAVRAGQWFNILTGGRNYLYMAQTSAVAPTTLEIEPPQRVEHADNDPLNFGAPVIEGLLSGPPNWSLDPDRLARGFTFSIEEFR